MRAETVVELSHSTSPVLVLVNSTPRTNSVDNVISITGIFGLPRWK